MGPDADGVVDDQPRIDYLDAHLRAVAEAVAARRRRPRLLHLVAAGQLRVDRGLHPALRPVHVDYDTLVRTPKRSFQWYADMIAAQPADPSESFR